MARARRGTEFQPSLPIMDTHGRVPASPAFRIFDQIYRADSDVRFYRLHFKMRKMGSKYGYEESRDKSRFTFDY